MSRASEKEVRAVIEVNPSDLNLGPFIRAASNLVDRVKACAVDKGKTLTADQLLDIETFWAAHLISFRSGRMTSKSTERASGSWQYPKTDYSELAMTLDTSGCLENMLKSQKASIFWGGKTEPEQLDYTERMT